MKHFLLQANLHVTINISQPQNRGARSGCLTVQTACASLCRPPWQCCFNVYFICWELTLKRTPEIAAVTSWQPVVRFPLSMLQPSETQKIFSVGLWGLKQCALEEHSYDKILYVISVITILCILVKNNVSVRVVRVFFSGTRIFLFVMFDLQSKVELCNRKSLAVVLLMLVSAWCFSVNYITELEQNPVVSPIYFFPLPVDPFRSYLTEMFVECCTSLRSRKIDSFSS